jgi:hypothetical protein
VCAGYPELDCHCGHLVQSGNDQLVDGDRAVSKEKNCHEITVMRYECSNGYNGKYFTVLVSAN